MSSGYSVKKIHDLKAKSEDGRTDKVSNIIVVGLFGLTSDKQTNSTLYHSIPENSLKIIKSILTSELRYSEFAKPCDHPYIKKSLEPIYFC